jgi:hypothetical protein
MDSLKKRTDLNSQSNDGRRSFIWKMGAVMTAGILAPSVPAAAKSVAAKDLGPENGMRELSERLAILEAEKSIIGLYHTYESLLNDGIYDKISELFVTDGEAVYNGGVFKGRNKGVTRLYNKRFRSGLAGKKLDATLDSKEQHLIELSEDHLSAKANFPFAIQVGTPMVSDSVLISMARLHGEGIYKWRENGICELSLSRQSREDVWMINRLEYRTESKSVSVPLFAKVFPDDHEGPDTLV